MSLQQIVREFPFLQFYAVDEGHTVLWEDAVIQVRVSRLSLDALELSMEKIKPEERFSLYRSCQIFDEKGRGLFHREVSGKEFTTVGEFLLDTFPVREREVSEEVCYVLYITDRQTARWRYRKGVKTAKPYLVWKSEHREIVLFKMPRKATLWELLQRYRQQKAMMS